MATACWAFIVAKSTRLEPAPLLVFRPLQATNSKKISTACQQAEISSEQQLQQPAASPNPKEIRIIQSDSSCQRQQSPPTWNEANGHQPGNGSAHQKCTALDLFVGTRKH
jgi:hypothetical protein